jgi:GNAT superfamily N-acetyltransferase
MMDTTERILRRAATDDEIVRALAHNWHAVRRSFAAYPGVQVHDDAKAFWFSTGIPSGWFNAVLYAHFTPEEAEVEIEHICAHFKALGLPWLWFIDAASGPADLAERLQARGMQHLWDCRNMGMRLPDAPLARPLPPEVAIYAVNDEATFALWRTMVLTEDDDADGATSPSVALQLATAQSPDKQHFVATMLGEPVARATIVYAAGIAGVYAVETLPAARGRGLGTAITCVALDHAREQGYEVAALQASQMGFNIYTRIGFDLLPSFPAYGWQTPKEHDEDSKAD